MCRPPSSDGGPVVSYTQHPVSNRVSFALHVCFLTGVPWRRRPGRCSPFYTPIPPASSGIRRGGGGDSPARRPGAVVLPQSRSPVPSPAVLGVTLPNTLIIRRRRWGTVIGRERRRVRPVIAPPPSLPLPVIQLQSRR